MCGDYNPLKTVVDVQYVWKPSIQILLAIA